MFVRRSARECAVSIAQVGEAYRESRWWYVNGSMDYFQMLLNHQASFRRRLMGFEGPKL
jgi:hypothetical protein